MSKTIWYVSTFLPDYPEEITAYKWAAGGRYILYGEGYECVAGPEEIFDGKREALEEALRRIRGRIRTMHDEGMEDHDYNRSREWADALADAIAYELESGRPVNLQELANDLRTARHERGEW